MIDDTAATSKRVETLWVACVRYVVRTRFDTPLSANQARALRSVGDLPAIVTVVEGKRRTPSRWGGPVELVVADALFGHDESARRDFLQTLEAAAQERCEVELGVRSGPDDLHDAMQELRAVAPRYRFFLDRVRRLRGRERARLRIGISSEAAYRAACEGLDDLIGAYLAKAKDLALGRGAPRERQSN
jgi:hypothetical protein